MNRSLLALLLATAAITACGRATPVSDAIRQQSVEGAEVRIADITKFSWDTFLVFSPYTTNVDICSRLGPMFRECAKEVPAVVDEGAYLLVFASADRVVHIELYPRGKGDFCEISCALVLTREQAVFRVNRDDATVGQYLKLTRTGGHA